MEQYILFLIISPFNILIYALLYPALIYNHLLSRYSLLKSSFFCNFTFFIPIFLDFFLIFSTFFFIGPINIIEVFTGINPCYAISFSNFFSLFFQLQFIIIFILLFFVLISLNRRYNLTG